MGVERTVELAAKLLFEWWLRSEVVLSEAVSSGAVPTRERFRVEWCRVGWFWGE